MLSQQLAAWLWPRSPLSTHINTEGLLLSQPRRATDGADRGRRRSGAAPGARDQTSNLQVTSQPALPPELLPPPDRDWGEEDHLMVWRLNQGFKVPHVRGTFKEQQENLEGDFEPHWKPVERSRYRGPGTEVPVQRSPAA